MFIFAPVNRSFAYIEKFSGAVYAVPNTLSSDIISSCGSPPVMVKFRYLALKAVKLVPDITVMFRASTLSNLPNFSVERFVYEELSVE